METRRPLSRWLPAVLGLFLLLDAGGRLVPLDLLAFRGWEVMILRRGPGGPFAPSRRFATPWSYGDLPNLAGRVTVLYSGGDDFAVYGAWDSLILLAREIQRVFRLHVDTNLKVLPGPDGLYPFAIPGKSVAL